MSIGAKYISRRTLLKAAGVMTLGARTALGMDARRTVGQYVPALSTSTAFYQFNMGDFQIAVIQDSILAVDLVNFAVNTPEADVEALLTANNYPAAVQNVTVDVMLVKAGENLVLIDTGLGSGSEAPPRLLPTLELIGVQPEAITNVIISHFHPDHIGSVSNEDALLFPNASVHIAQVEWDLLQSSPRPDALSGMIDLALAQLQPAIENDRLEFYEDGDEILPGIQAVATPGHTPGHHALLLSSGGQQLLNLIDTAIHHVISLQNPGWHFVSDILPDVAVATRRSTLQRAVDEKLFVYGYHFPFPGVGVVDTDGDGFRFLPVGF
jgi:glyoxylase-like metal-dependent hydrolase (beta-lactamase superfamily II)